MPGELDLSWVTVYLPPFILGATLISGLYLLRTLALRSIADTSHRYRARKIITYGGYFIIALVMLSLMNARIAQFSVIIGAIGAGVAFALQEVIASLAGWIALSFGNFYKPGDRVKLGGIKGDVIDIGLLRTTLMEVGDWVSGDQYNGRMVRVANSFVFKEPVFNYSGEFSFLWDEFKLPIRHGSDWQSAEAIIRNALLEHSGAVIERSQEAWSTIVRRYLIEQATLEPMVTLVVTDAWIEFTARYVVDYKKRRSTRDAIMRSILRAIEGSGGSIELGGTTLEIVGMPSLKVDLAKNSN